MDQRKLRFLRPSGLLVAAAALLLVPPAAHAQYHMEDSLRGGTTAGSALGGTFTDEGWRVDSRTDRIWFALPTLVEGSIEFTVTGITHDNLVVNDNEIFAMYEDGYGMGEPINYNPEYRNNHYKCMIRIYGQAEGDALGEQKLMWGICPSGAPGYDACGCEEFFEEPRGGDRAWGGGPERLRVEWGGGVARYLRNGTEVIAIDYSASGVEFGPVELHFTLGCPRAAAVDTSGMPVGALFSDLVVDGIEGPVALCPGTEPDGEEILPEPVEPAEPVDEPESPDVTEPVDAGGDDGGVEPPIDAASDLDAATPDADMPAEGADLVSEGGCACSMLPGL